MLSLKSKMKMMDIRRTETAEHQSPRACEAAPQVQGPSPRGQQTAAVNQPGQQQTSTANPQGSKYLIISVVEARNLVAKDYDTHSSDPFVKITLGSTSKKTRAIYRNCHPLWEQKLLFPIDGLSEGEPLLVELFDKDVTGKEFLGQVMMTLGKALAIESDESARSNFWLVLSKKRSTDIVGGELCLGFEVTHLDQRQHTQYLSDLEAQLNPDLLAATYNTKALHLQLKGINGLTASGLCAGGRGKGCEQQLSLFIKYGRVTFEKRLPAPTACQMSEDDPGLSACQDAGSYEVTVNEEVVIPLTAAVRAVPLVARKKDELSDIKLYLKSQDTLIAKTQIPIAAVPLSTSSSVAPAQFAPEEGSRCTSCSPSPGGVMAPPPLSARVTNDATAHKGPAEVLAGEQYFTSASAPTTPRGTTSDLFLGVSSPCSSASPLSGLPSSPMNCGRADTFGLTTLNKRQGGLAGWLGSSSNLSTLNASSRCNSLASTMVPHVSEGQYSSGGAAKPVVEGSLDSVTACTRGLQVHTPAGLHGRRVQGLAEMHEAGNTLRKPLKAMFAVPPREVSRLDWVPTKIADDQAELQPLDCQRDNGRAFCRVMESTVPMYCNLEISLNLAVVEQKAAPDAVGVEVSTGSTASDQELCEDSMSDDEEASQATPIQLPAACELVLQDVTLQGIGVNRLYALLISADSELMKTHHAAQQVTEVKVGPWRAAAAGCGYQRLRDVSYTKRLNIPLPLTPEKCHVWEEHRLLMKEAGGWVVQVVCKNDAPKGDCFEAHVQLCGAYVSSNSSRFRVSMQLNWTKNTWGKGMVQGGAETDAKRGYEALVKLLRQQAGSSITDNSSSIDLQAATLGEGQGDLKASAALEHAASKGRWQRLSNSNLALPLQFALVLSLMLLAWAVVSAGSSISRDLRELTAAAKACGAPPQGAAVMSGLL